MPPVLPHTGGPGSNVTARRGSGVPKTTLPDPKPGKSPPGPCLSVCSCKHKPTADESTDFYGLFPPQNTCQAKQERVGEGYRRPARPKPSPFRESTAEKTNRFKHKGRDTAWNNSLTRKASRL
jgi:hypothetical protein